MFIRITRSPNGKNKRVYMVEGFRDKNGKTKQRIIKRYGELDDLLAKDSNALEKLRYEAKSLSSEKIIQININRNRLIDEASPSVNYGYFFLEKIYKNLGIEDYLKNHDKNANYEYSLNQIMRMLVFSRILNPNSKLEAFNNQKSFFEPFNNKLIDIYRSLSVMNEIKEDVQVLMNKNITEKYNRDCSLVFYDLTNYYFEIEKEDELKRVGISKERKTTPIIQMGLLIDKNKIPIGYQLFSGNVSDSKTLLPMINKLKTKFNIKNVVIAADKGVNSALNLASLASNGDGYIVSQKVRGANKDFVNKVLNQKGYVLYSDNFKLKEWIRTREVKDNANNIVTLKEKVIVYWSKNYDQREKHKREKLNQRLEEFIKNPTKLNASNRYGIKRYIKTNHFDKKTGELKKINPINTFNHKKYGRDVSLDGYYALVTSEINKPANKIIASYHELHKIEESFKVIKSDLEGRPVYVHKNDRIEGHFLTCFIALTILRIIEKTLDYKFSVSKIRVGLRKASCKEFGKAVYSIEPRTNVLTSLEEIINTSIHYETATYEKIRRYKKEVLHNKF